MYFRPILQNFTREFPNTRVAVSRDFPVQDYPELPLWPVLDLRTWRAKRKRDQRAYSTDRLVPTAASVRRLAGFDAALYIAIEFTPVALIGFLLARLRRRRLLLLIESHPKYRGGADGAIARRVKSRVARSADHVLVSNAEAAGYVTKDLGVSPARLSVGPYLTSAPTEEHQEVQATRRTRLQQEPVKLLFLNSVTRRKGLLELLDALAILEQDARCRGRWRLDVVGAGEAMSEVQERMAALGLEENMTIRGALPYEDIWEVYRSADVVVCPTLADYRSLAGFEAVNSGKPVVISALDGATRELAGRMPSVRVIDPRDAVSTAKGLCDLISDDTQLEAVLAAAEEIPEDFSYAAVQRHLSAAVTAALGRLGPDSTPTAKERVP
ncbi:glycosyltransferase family 4 protein [Geodermatophilus sp. SYSU D00804]